MNNHYNVRKLYLIRFFASLIPAYVIERLFWESRGMTIQMVTHTEIIFAATVVLLEVPTGILADRWGRKQMLLLSASLYAAELLILVYAHAFWHFALAIVLAGISRSAGSGAENALLYDGMLAAGRAEDFEKILGRLNALDLVAAILAALSGGLLAGKFELELHYWLSVASALTVIGLTATLAEVRVRAEDDDDEGSQRNPLDYLRASASFFKTHADVRSVVFTGMVIGSSISFLYEFWQIYLARLAVPVAYFGLFSAVIMLLGLPGNLLAHRLLLRYGARPPLLAATLLASAGFLFAAFVHHPCSLAAMLLTSLAAGIAEPIATGYLHRRIESSMRATIDSFQSLGLNAVLAASSFGFGLASAHFDVFGGYGFVGALCAAYGFGICAPIVIKRIRCKVYHIEG
ncbi:MFS transporter [Paenibacillus xanthanilyticus]|uniref:MFS transporter n=1 Tax=Paenibacillus xanthanilyticus TaxID=1783531 RepID=A0ABV8K5U8_9BACL